jgi:hypothetical protein
VRSRYLMVLETYVRWAFAWFVPVIAFWVYQGVAIVAPRDARSFPLGSDWALFGLFVLGTFAAVLYGHLSETVGSERGRLTPGLAQAHLIVAGALVSIVTVVIPLVLSLATYGLRGPHLAVGGVALAEFSIPCYLFRWNRWGDRLWQIPLAIAFTLAAPIAMRAAWFPTNAEVAGLFLISFACLFGVANHWLHFDEEKLPLRDRAGDASKSWEWAGRGFAYILRLLTPSRLRRPGRRGYAVREGLWRRALHWDAGWWNIATAAQLGTLMGFPIAVMSLIQAKFIHKPFELHRSVFIIFVPLCACLPIAWVLSPPTRRYWINEFLRPYSRQQLVQAAGVAVALSALVGGSILVGIPLAAAWIMSGACPVTEAELSTLALALSGALSFFALCGANWRAPRSYLLLILVVIVYTVAVWTPVLEPNRVSHLEVTIRALGLLILGTGITAAAYRSWLNRDVV